VTITRRFRAKSTRSLTPGSFATASIHVGLAEANTSVGPPAWICCARPSEGPKLNRTVTPSCAFSKSVPISPNASVSDDAARTVSVVFVDPPWAFDEQADIAIIATETSATATRLIRGRPP
jgi:hypothetical protein